jgi:hypothetical protein
LESPLIFEPFPKMARLFRDCVVSEKIDGTNAQIVIEVGPFVATGGDAEPIVYWQDGGLTYRMSAGSRSRWLTPGKTTDNFGFAGWVKDNHEELKKLGEGKHYGEWWGKGIQRGYGLSEKRFSLFNVARWSDDVVRPACCHVVPTLYRGAFTTQSISVCLDDLKLHGSFAAPGFMKPEGIVTWHEAARALFKTTLDNDAIPKGMAA